METLKPPSSQTIKAIPLLTMLSSQQLKLIFIIVALFKKDHSPTTQSDLLLVPERLKTKPGLMAMPMQAMMLLTLLILQLITLLNQQLKLISIIAALFKEDHSLTDMDLMNIQLHQLLEKEKHQSKPGQNLISKILMKKLTKLLHLPVMKLPHKSTTTDFTKEEI